MCFVQKNGETEKTSEKCHDTFDIYCALYQLCAKGIAAKIRICYDVKINMENQEEQT